MKPLFKFLSLGMMLVLASCSTGGNKSTPTSSSSSSEAQTETDGALIKRVADDMFDYGGANRDDVSNAPMSNSLTPVDENQRGPEIELPAVLVYLTGVLSDIDGVDVINKAFEFSGVYEFDFSISETPNWVEQEIGLTVNTKIDKENGKLLFSGLQLVSSGGTVFANTHIFIDISYNFTTKELGDFKMYQEQSPGYIYYFEVINGEAFRRGNDISDEEINAINNKYNEYLTAFDTLCETKVVATGSLVRTAQEAFVSTQKYANKLFGQKVDSVRIKE